MDNYEIIESYINGNINFACQQVYKNGGYDFFYNADLTPELYRKFTLSYIHYLEKA